MPVSVLIADDHDIIREGIKSILSKKADYTIVGEAGDGEEAIQIVKRLKPQLLLLDISMPKRGGLDLIQQVHYVSPKTKIVIITMHRANIYMKKAFKLGVKGYLNKDNVVEDLLPALQRISQGKVYISAKASQYLIEEATQDDRERKGEGPVLTERESDILRLVVDGKTARQIADILFISPRTVENYKNSLLKKLGLHKSSDLIKYAIQQRIVETED